MTQIQQTTPGELERDIDSADADGRYVSPLARSELDRITADGVAMGMRVAGDHMTTARAVGAEVADAFARSKETADALRERIRVGEVDPAVARAEVDSLLGEFSAAERRAGTFEAAVAAAVSIESDPLSFAEDFYRRHPSVRPEVSL